MTKQEKVPEKELKVLMRYILKYQLYEDLWEAFDLIQNKLRKAARQQGKQR